MERIETAYGNFNVYLNRIISSEGILFHISFVDNSNKAHVALLQESGNEWAFVSPETLPDWIKTLQDDFNILIAQSLVKEQQPAMTTTA